MVVLAKKIEKLEKTVVKMMDMLKTGQQRDACNSDVKVKTEDDDCVVSAVANHTPCIIIIFIL